MDNIIEIKNLRFSYNNNEILKGIDLNIQKGKLTCILGPNGCGKTTLLKNILGYLKSNSGEIKINHKNHLEYTQKEKAKLISFVPQKSELMAEMSVKDFVLMGRLPHLTNSWNGYSSHDHEIMNSYLKELDLDKFSNRIATTLSGGEFQRVLLARALTQETQIILLDEPTSALDLNHALELLNKVKNNVVKKNLTAVAVLHDLNLASMFADNIIMLYRGKVFKSGAPKDIITKENLKIIYNLECDIIYNDNIPYIIPKLNK